MRFLSGRDAYLHTMYIQAAPQADAWVRLHRTGREALALVTHPEGLETDLDLTLDLAGMLGPGEKRVEVRSRTLEVLSQGSAQGAARLQVHVPAQDFVAIHIF